MTKHGQQRTRIKRTANAAGLGTNNVNTKFSNLKSTKPIQLVLNVIICNFSKAAPVDSFLSGISQWQTIIQHILADKPFFKAALQTNMPKNVMIKTTTLVLLYSEQRHSSFDWIFSLIFLCFFFFQGNVFNLTKSKICY